MSHFIKNVGDTIALFTENRKLRWKLDKVDISWKYEIIFNIY